MPIRETFATDVHTLACVPPLLASSSKDSDIDRQTMATGISGPPGSNRCRIPSRMKASRDTDPVAIDAEFSLRVDGVTITLRCPLAF